MSVDVIDASAGVVGASPESVDVASGLFDEDVLGIAVADMLVGEPMVPFRDASREPQAANARINKHAMMADAGEARELRGT